MNSFMYNIVTALGTVLVLIAISIVSIGYLWQLVKPTVERTELQYYKSLKE